MQDDARAFFFVTFRACNAPSIVIYTHDKPNHPTEIKYCCFHCQESQLARWHVFLVIVYVSKIAQKLSSHYDRCLHLFL